MATVIFDEVAIRQLNDNRPINFTWPRENKTFTYQYSTDNGASFTAGTNTIEEVTPDGSVAEYKIPYDGSERPTESGTVIYKVTDGTDTGKIYVNVLGLSDSIPPPADPDDNTVFTSLIEMQREFSNVGVAEHTGDVSNNTEIINEIIQRATSEVLTYLGSRYSTSNLASNTWIRYKTTLIACYMLSKRRGNPALYMDDYGEALMDLAQVRDGVRYLDIPNRVRAVVQTPMQDSRFFHQNRIDYGRSTKVYGGQRLAYRLAVSD